ncbi:MAG: LysE family translocator [Enterobacteriaceae bacterium]|uniref:LysE family translocator n=1 Tax=Phytobacter diazotrophicus TaxID=395631 RepID=UPI00290EE62C|nr:LysE family translocator [Phytobacter diazotrophicus]MDU4997930.1 LysE family translocator [Enterobacteriaceae bacterium]MDU7200554.1 LysE family translocator [Enterobacteriaceae bacterium]MDV2874345.1 LysE family translocator [Phytobacter diazotrophicus]
MNMLYSYLPFMLFAFVASITPGPTNILILASSQRYGIRATLPAVFGACVAASLIVFISGAGAGEILRGYPLLREGMSWAGALWLSWMSWQLFTAPAADLNEKSGEPFSGKAAAMLQLINPKTWMMALAVVSLFAPNGAHPVREVSFLSLSFLLISVLCLGAWTLLGKAVNRLFRSAASLIWFQRAMALCLLISAWAGFVH